MSEKRRKRRQRGNGSIDRAANGTWKSRWCEAGKRKTRGGLRSRDDAERVLAKVLGDIAQGRSGLPAEPASIPKLSELAPDSSSGGSGRTAPASRMPRAGGSTSH